MTTIIVANRSYAILEFEFQRVGASGDGAAAHALMDIGRPSSTSRPWLARWAFRRGVSTTFPGWRARSARRSRSPGRT